MSNPEKETLADLIDAHLLGELTEAQRQELNRRLQEEASAREIYLRALRHEVLLGEVLDAQREASAASDRVPPKDFSHQRRSSSGVQRIKRGALGRSRNVRASSAQLKPAESSNEAAPDVHFGTGIHRYDTR